jgi:pectate lyase
MNKTKLLRTGLLLCLLIAIFQTSYAQDECQSFGWANYDGQNQVGPPTGGGNATPIQVTTFAQLKAEAESSSARVIYVMNDMGAGYKGSSGDVLKVKSNKTIIGFKPGITVKCSWQISGVSNIIVRNLICRGPGNSNSEQNWDAVSINGSKRIWFDHCTIMDGEDGNFDVTKGSDNITVTWCKFTYSSSGPHNLSNLIGSSDNEPQSHGKLNITYAYCWWENADSRTPRSRYGKIHVLNCYYRASGGTRAGFMANQRVEGCYFDNIKNPIGLISPGGQAGIFVIDCHFVGASGNSQSEGGYTVFTPPYPYTKFAAKDVKSIVTNATCGAGATMANPTSCCGTAIKDCNGVDNGTAYKDDCNICVGGNTGKTACTKDCNGDINGNATLDQCGVCIGGNTGKTACSGAMQGESFCSAIGVQESSNLGFSGTGYVNFDNVIGSIGTWYLTANSAGSKSIGIRYANGTTTARGMTVSVNETNQTTFTAAPTGTWTTWTTEFVTLNLVAGVNQIKLTSLTADGGPNIDLFAFPTGVTAGGCTADCNGTIGGATFKDDCGTCVAGNTGKIACIQDCNNDWGGTATLDNCGACIGGNTTNKPCSGFMEAENACSADGILLEDKNTGFSGLGYVNADNTIDAGASWSIVSTSAQTATLSLRYANSGTTSRDGDLYINGSKVTNVKLPPTGSWTTWEMASVTIALANGVNEITLKATTADGLANIDLISFSEGVSEGICIITGNTAGANTEFTIHPNPTQNRVFWNTEKDWILLDIQGKELAKGKGSSTDLSEFPNGVYFLKIDQTINKVLKN